MKNNENKLLRKYLPMYREIGIETPITEKTSIKKAVVSREEQLLKKYLPTYVSLQELRKRLNDLKESIS